MSVQQNEYLSIQQLYELAKKSHANLSSMLSRRDQITLPI